MKASPQPPLAPFVVIVSLLLAVPTPALGQAFEDCVQNINNATVIVPASIQASVDGDSLEAGDAIAVYTDEGTCAGQGVWNGDNLSISAAGADSQQPEGFAADERLRFHVWDASTGTAYEADVAYATCDGANPLCKDDGAYESNRLFSLRTLDAAPAADAIPVELAGFEVTVNEGATPSAHRPEAVLRWETASESNNAGFEVQHRVPDAGPDAWERVAFVEGQGTTQETHRYTHRVDDLLPGTHTFRLKQVDLDGESTYTEAVEAVVTLSGAFDLVAPYPNPFRQQARFVLTVAEAQRVNIAAFNQLGQRVATLHSGTLPPNTQHTFQLDADRLASGLYFIQIQGEEFSVTERAVLVR